MKKQTLLIWLLLLVSTSFFGNAICANPTNPTFHLTIIHTNDFHGFEPMLLAKQATIINQIRSQEKNVLWIDTGDVFTRGKYQYQFFGEMEFVVLNAMHPDFFVIGNNEFKASNAYDSQKHLFDRLNQANFPILCANVKLNKDQSYLPKVKPYHIKEIEGIKIGFFGITTCRSKDYAQTQEFAFTDEIKTVKEIYPEVAAKSDIVIALTHIGFDMDQSLAVAVPELAAIVGGDSHTRLDKPVMVGKTPIVQAGALGEYLGRLDLYFEFENNIWILQKSDGYLIKTDTAVDNPEIKQLIQSYLDRIERPAA